MADPGGGGGAAPILVRKDFADLLKWSGAIETDADGCAEIPLEFPDNLTTWKARVWTLGKGTRVGEGSAEIITSKDLLVRLQAPRFLVERDEAVLSAVVHNDYDAPKSVKVSLGTRWQEPRGHRRRRQNRGDRREVRGPRRLARQGAARGRGDAADDAPRPATMATRSSASCRCWCTAWLRQDAWSRAVDPDAESARILMEVPDKRRPDQSKLTVRFSPTIAGAVVDAIPYLADYPYGCTEQTLEPLRARGDRPADAERSQDQPGAKSKPSAPTSTRRNSAMPPSARRSGNNGSTTRCSMRRRWTRWSPPAWTNSCRCRTPTAAGAGSPATASIPIPTPPRWSSTDCSIAKANGAKSRIPCSTPASPG